MCVILFFYKDFSLRRLFYSSQHSREIFQFDLSLFFVVCVLSFLWAAFLWTKIDSSGRENERRRSKKGPEKFLFFLQVQQFLLFFLWNFFYVFFKFPLELVIFLMTLFSSFFNFIFLYVFYFEFLWKFSVRKFIDCWGKVGKNMENLFIFM